MIFGAFGRRSACALFAGLSLLATADSASAGEVQLAIGPAVQGSSWRGDALVGHSLKLGYRFGDFIAVDSLGRLSYATVDERFVTYLSLGGTIYGRLGKARPYFRLAFVHQHEESASSVRDDPFGAIFGVGDGIRHRGGFGSSLGFDLPVYKRKATEMTVGIEATGSWFPDERGPRIYAGASFWLGFNFDLDGGAPRPQGEQSASR
ncbi:MAG: hypothetical protein KF819_18725 [Labilithrix sp.]|nr:hypothetical protein [Labilithrix sp.]